MSHPCRFNLTHITHPEGKGAQLLFLEPQTACQQPKVGCCGKLRRRGGSPEIMPTCEPLPQLLPSFQTCGLKAIKTQYMAGKAITSGS